MMKSRNAIPRFTHDIVMFEGTALPERFIGRLIGADPLHHNLVAAERYAVGSTFETSDTETPLTGDDIAFRPVFLANAPDGSLYIADFYEEFIAHGQNYQGQIDPNSGRIYRLRGKDSTLIKDVDLAKKSSAELVGVLSSPNRWHRQTAVRVLGERADRSVVDALKALLQKPATHPALEALWALHQMGALDEATSIAALSHSAGPMRAWAIRLAGDPGKLSPTFMAAVTKLAQSEDDAEVRAQVASTSRRLPFDQALPLVADLAQRDADAKDAYTPLICWWTVESHMDGHRDAVLAMLKNPADWDRAVMKEFLLPRIMRRLAAKGARADFLACAQLFESATKDEHRKALMTGFEEAFTGRALPPLPRELVAALAKSGQASPVLGVRLGEPEAIDAALKLAADAKGKPADRLTSVALFGEVKEPKAVPVLLEVAKEVKNPADLRKTALASLQTYDAESIGKAIAGVCASLPADVKPAAVNLLASRAAWAGHLLKLVETGTLKQADIPAEITARLQSHKDATIAAAAKKLLIVRPPADQAARRQQAEKIKATIAAAPGDPYKGEPIFMERCGVCHTLFFKGGKIAPNLTAYQRDDLGTMLTSILDPSAEIREGFRSYSVSTKDGRELTGFLTDNDAAVIAIRGFDGQDVRIPRADVTELNPQPNSLMPEGLLNDLDDTQIRDLFAYLRIPQPITK